MALYEPKHVAEIRFLITKFSVWWVFIGLFGCSDISDLSCNFQFPTLLNSNDVGTVIPPRWVIVINIKGARQQWRREGGKPGQLLGPGGPEGGPGPSYVA